MVKPRYDADKDESRHGATSPDKCPEMENKYGWKLKRVEIVETPVLEVDCVFNGKTEFPKPYNETEED